LQVNSTDTDRTIASALALAYGLYPPAASSTACSRTNEESDAITGVTVVPVHSTAAQHDVVARAYEKCPTYNAALLKLYNSTEFIQYERQHFVFFQNLLVSLAAQIMIVYQVLAAGARCTVVSAAALQMLLGSSIIYVDVAAQWKIALTLLCAASTAATSQHCCCCCC
jgi:hypothetical protein